jgi:hypothetical protein
MLLENIAVMNPAVVYPGFYQADVAASQADVPLLIAGSGGGDGYVMPKAGYVIGLTGSLSVAASAGQLTVGVTVDGVEQPNTTQTITTQQALAATFSVDSHRVRFAAGQQAGVEISTDAAWDGTTADLDAQLIVVFEDWDYH